METIIYWRETWMIISKVTILLQYFTIPHFVDLFDRTLNPWIKKNLLLSWKMLYCNTHDFEIWSNRNRRVHLKAFKFFITIKRTRNLWLYRQCIVLLINLVHDVSFEFLFMKIPTIYFKILLVLIRENTYLLLNSVDSCFSHSK